MGCEFHAYSLTIEYDRLTFKGQTVLCYPDLQNCVCLAALIVGTSILRIVGSSLASQQVGAIVVMNSTIR